MKDEEVLAGGNSTASERLSRLDDLIRAYGLPFEHRDVYGTLVSRLEELAEFTDGRAAATGRTDFLDHSAMYRRDRDTMAAPLLPRSGCSGVSQSA